MLRKTFRTLRGLALAAGVIALVGCASATRTDLQHHQAASYHFSLHEPLMLALHREKVFIYGGFATKAKKHLRGQTPQYLGVYGNAGSAMGPLKVVGLAGLAYVEPAAIAEDKAVLAVEFSNGARHSLYNAFFVACDKAPEGLADAQASDCARVATLQAKTGAISLHLGWTRSPLVTGGNTEYGWLPVSRLWETERVKATVTTGAAVTEEEARLNERFSSGQARQALERVKREALLKQQRQADLMAELSKAKPGTSAVCVQTGRSGSGTPLQDHFELRCDTVRTATLGELKQAGWSMTRSDRISFSDDTVSWKVELKKTSAGEPGK